ncbi:L-lactate permease [Priestia endophytica]|uniref:L-lactate permease n=1 Tax=Priestia endophytica TaxID=135735 RepID=UPI000F5353CF|nr:L-lactate permease [Priestia endophytica]RPK10820.1 hypothetical protein FH5_03898 [Priestia endophytica]
MLKIILSFLPLFSILLLLFFFKKSSIFTGMFTLILTVLLALSPFFHKSPTALLHPMVKTSLTTFMILYILFFGILLFHLMEKAGAVQKIASFISLSTNDRIYQVLILSLGLSPLIESVSGFGLAIIVIAPILLALGFNGIQASLLSLISLCAIPWGTLALGTIIGAELSNVDLDMLGVGSALMSFPFYIYFAILVCTIAARKREVLKRLPEIIFVSLVLSSSILLCNRYISVELAGLFGSFITIIVVFTLIKIRNKTPDISSTEKLTFIKNISPYLLLTFVLLTSRMIPSFQENLNSTFNIKMENYDFELPLLYSPGFFLILSCIFVIILFKLSISNILESLTLSVQKCFPVILTTFLFIFISEIMAESGMIHVLSNFAAYSFGAYFIYLSPFIGAVGGFLTGSNTASNTMFIKLQTQTAAKIGSTPLLAACTQNVSSSMITMINPSRVTLSTSVCKVGKHENIIQKKMIFIVAGTLSVLALEIFLFSLCI